MNTRSISGPNFSPATRGTEVRAARFELSGKSPVGVKEPSDVVGMPGGGFMVVGDLSNRALYVAPNGRNFELELEGVKRKTSGLEAVAYDPQKKHLFVASEETHELFRYELRFDKDGAPSAKLEKSWDLDLGGRSNKGVEGLAFLPGHLSPTGRPQLLVAKEGDPKTLALLEDNGTGKPRELELDKALKEACKDFSAVAVDPRTGHLFITSDESSLLAEVRLVNKGGKPAAELVQATPLKSPDGEPLERVEGVTFDERGDLFILLEDQAALYHYRRLA